MRSTVFSLIAITILCVSTAAAATECDASNDQSPVLSLDDRDENFLSGLGIGLMFGLTPATFPQEQIDAAVGACSRGGFEAAGESYRVFGADSDVPPRWAISSTGQIAYLAVMPPPDVTLDWARRGGRGSITFTSAALYVLAIVNGDKRDVFVFFEGMPGDEQLRSAFKDALEGRLPRLATFDPQTGHSQFAERRTL